jgi:hypothetical protein
MMNSKFYQPLVNEERNPSPYVNKKGTSFTFLCFYRLDKILHCGLLLDLERDGSVEILAGDAKGNILVLDAVTGNVQKQKMRLHKKQVREMVPVIQFSYSRVQGEEAKKT